MALLSSPFLFPGLVIAWVLAYYLVPYFTTYASLRHIPGPFVARFSNLWLAAGARQGQKFAWIDTAHRRYGRIVRVGYNHVSIAEPEGLHTVYAHGNGFIKDQFYSAFVSGVPGVFNVRDRAEHTRKRKIIAHAFSPGAVHSFETHMADNLRRWVAQLDRIAYYPTKDGYARMNMMPWCTYLAFDIIGDLAFGAPFDMVDKGRDECEAQLVPGGPVIIASGAETLNRRGEVSSTLGWYPYLKPYAQYLPDPFFTQGIAATRALHGIAEAAVAKRLGPVDTPLTATTMTTESRSDILDLLCHARDAKGQPMPREELVSETLTQLIAGSDTVSNTACAAIYWILDGERSRPSTIISRLHAELDPSIPFESIATHDAVRNLPFLRRCIDEAMRLHSTSAIGLPRIVTAPCGATHGSTTFPQGTVLSVPSYTLHHDEGIWGSDVESFDPDRWLPERLTERQKMAFNPFSYGPRACVGQNVARMELTLILATVFRRYEFVLEQKELISMEGFSKKPVECWLGIKRRENK